MLKVMIFLRRRDDLSAEAFERHLRDTHTPLVTQLPGLRRLVLNRVLPDPSGARPAWDVVAEDWFDSPEAMQAALGSAQGQAVNADAANFVDMSKLQFLVIHEEEVTIPSAV